MPDIIFDEQSGIQLVIILFEDFIIQLEIKLLANTYDSVPFK